jgi:RNA polymerase sigma-70 factor (ECF subfamily)
MTRRNRPWIDEFIRQHREMLLRYALFLCRDPDLAQDLVQETFIRMWRSPKAEHLAETAKPYYARKILLRLFLDYLRRQGNEAEVLKEIYEAPRGRPAEYPSDKAADREQILRFLEKLPERSREVFFLKVVGGFGPTEIGALLGLKPSTVSNYLSGIKRLIKEEHPDLGENNS